MIQPYYLNILHDLPHFSKYFTLSSALYKYFPWSSVLSKYFHDLPHFLNILHNLLYFLNIFHDLPYFLNILHDLPYYLNIFHDLQNFLNIFHDFPCYLQYKYFPLSTILKFSFCNCFFSFFFPPSLPTFTSYNFLIHLTISKLMFLQVFYYNFF